MGMPDAVTAGHAAMQAPVHVDALLLSASHRYMVRPLSSTRAMPGIPEMAFRSIVRPPVLDCALAAAVGLFACAVADDAAGAAVLPGLAPLEQAVAARAIPAAHAAAAIRFLIDAPS